MKVVLITKFKQRQVSLVIFVSFTYIGLTICELKKSSTLLQGQILGKTDCKLCAIFQYMLAKIFIGLQPHTLQPHHNIL